MAVVGVVCKVRWDVRVVDSGLIAFVVKHVRVRAWSVVSI